MRFQHGTRYGYKRAKCRCVLCTEWQRRDLLRYRARRAYDKADLYDDLAARPPQLIKLEQAEAAVKQWADLMAIVNAEIGAKPRPYGKLELINNTPQVLNELW